MKKQDPHREAYLHSVRTEKNQAERRRKHWRRGHRLSSGKRYVQAPFVDGRRVFSVPDVMALDTPEHYENLVGLVRSLRAAVLEKQERVCVDLSRLRDVKAAALLKLHVELQVLAAMSEDPQLITVRSPLDRRAKTTVEALGFYGFEGLEKEGNLAITSGLSWDGMNARLDKMNRCLFSNKLVMHDQPWQDLHAALSEAILNVQNHAYAHPEREEVAHKLGRRWWMMGSTIEDQLHLVIFDKGIGIPRSLDGKTHRVKEILRRYASRYFNSAQITDGGLIAAAMVYGRSRLKSKYGGGAGHGKGLSDIRNWVEQNPAGKLQIYSNAGKYSYNSAEKRVAVMDHQSSIHGTLIQWNIRLQ